MTELTLPSELRPADGRFGSGPSKVPQAALDALAATGGGVMGTSHRRERVRGRVQRLREGLATYFSLPDGYEVVLGNGGATLFWDAAAASLIDSRSAHAVFGEFSAKFAAVVRDAPFLDDPAVKDSPVGTHPHLEAVDGVDAYALTHCETSTGVVAPVARPAGADEGALVLVDATSAAGGVDVDVAEADAYYFSPQKAFASDGGLWVALMSPAALERVQSLDRAGRWVPAMLDLRQAVENSRKQQTLNTPAVATLLLMVHQLEVHAGGRRPRQGRRRVRRPGGARVRVGRKPRLGHPVRAGPGDALTGRVHRSTSTRPSPSAT